MPLARNAMYEGGTQILAAPTWDKSPDLAVKHAAHRAGGSIFVISCCMALRMDDIPDRYDFKNTYPKDRVIAGSLEMKEAILYADVELNLIADAKRMFDVSGHYARPDVFKFEVNDRPKDNKTY